MKANSRAVTSNQSGLHENLDELVEKHLKATFLKPFQQHTIDAFEQACQQIATVDRPIWLDSCCGTGDSARALAAQHSDHWIVGVDKSEHRLTKQRDVEQFDNLILIRADLNDFFRLAVQANWQLAHHTILYPNPWPKSSHVKRRWHGSAVFSDIIKLGGQIELRSNWPIYLQEFKRALAIAGFAQASVNEYHAEQPITAFEAKYKESGQTLWQLKANLNQNR